MASDQDQINERNCCLVIKGGKLTARTLAFAMRAFLAAGKKVTNQPVKKGKQTLKQLAEQDGKLENIQVSGDTVRAFESIARKYAVDYAVMEDLSENPPKHLVFFKARDTETMTAAFREFSAKQLDKNILRAPLAQTLARGMEKVKNQVLDRDKNKDRGRER